MQCESVYVCVVMFNYFPSMYLLGHVKAKMHGDGVGAWLELSMDWWYCQLSIDGKGALEGILCLLDLTLVVESGLSSLIQVRFCFLQRLNTSL